MVVEDPLRTVVASHHAEIHRYLVRLTARGSDADDCIQGGVTVDQVWRDPPSSKRNVPDQQRGDSLCLMYWSRHAAVGSERSEPHSSTPSRRQRWKRCASHLMHWCCDWSNIRWSA